jgi:hypothetical protein
MIDFLVEITRVAEAEVSPMRRVQKQGLAVDLQAVPLRRNR